MKLLFVLLVTMLFVPPRLHAGRPDAEITAHVNGVIVGDDYITFAVYGEARHQSFGTILPILRPTL